MAQTMAGVGVLTSQLLIQISKIYWFIPLEKINQTNIGTGLLSTQIWDLDRIKPMHRFWVIIQQLINQFGCQQ